MTDLIAFRAAIDLVKNDKEELNEVYEQCILENKNL